MSEVITPAAFYTSRFHQRSVLKITSCGAPEAVQSRFKKEMAASFH